MLLLQLPDPFTIIGITNQRLVESYETCRYLGLGSRGVQTDATKFNVPALARGSLCWELVVGERWGNSAGTSYPGSCQFRALTQLQLKAKLNWPQHRPNKNPQHRATRVEHSSKLETLAATWIRQTKRQ